MMEKVLIESLGWTANVIFVINYFLASRGKIKGDGVLFNIAIMTGCCFSGIYGMIIHRPPIVVLNAIFIFISITALRKINRAKKTANQERG